MAIYILRLKLNLFYLKWLVKMLLKISFVFLACHKKAFPRWYVILIVFNKHLLTYTNWRLSKVLRHLCFQIRFKKFIRIYAMWHMLKQDTFSNHGKYNQFYDSFHIETWGLTTIISLLLVKCCKNRFLSLVLNKKVFVG